MEYITQCIRDNEYILRVRWYHIIVLSLFSIFAVFLNVVVAAHHVDVMTFFFWRFVSLFRMRVLSFTILLRRLASFILLTLSCSSTESLLKFLPLSAFLMASGTFLRCLSVGALTMSLVRDWHGLGFEFLSSISFLTALQTSSNSFIFQLLSGQVLLLKFFIFVDLLDLKMFLGFSGARLTSSLFCFFHF